MKKAKFIRVSLLVLSILFIGAQAIRPDKTNPTVVTADTMPARLHVPPGVETVLRRACYDCHSHQTQWPWYSHIAPASWLLIDHVNDGRRHLNFSAWAQYDAKKAGRKLEEICEEIEAGAMPLRSYLALHPRARLSAQEVQALCDWANEERTRIGYEMEGQEGRR